jgi:hypothetical protein
MPETVVERLLWLRLCRAALRSLNQQNGQWTAQGYFALHPGGNIIQLNQNVGPNPSHYLIGYRGGQWDFVNLIPPYLQSAGVPAGTFNDDTFWAVQELHELGHILGGFRSDVGNASLSLSYTKTVIQNCFPQLCAN